MGFEIRYTIFSSSTHQKLLNRKFINVNTLPIYNCKQSIIPVNNTNLIHSFQQATHGESVPLIYYMCMTFGVNNNTFTYIQIQAMYWLPF